jgi:methylglutaconyl-CoA hydratase
MEHLRTTLDKRGVLTLTLDRAELHNAFDDALIGSLTAALLEAERDPAVRVLVLTGAGPSFSAGADLNWMQRMARATEEENEHDALALAGLMRSLNYLNCPTVARVNGSAFGGGVGLIACCDITIAVDGARFGITEARLGLAPAVISPYVSRRIGERHARRYFLSGERFDAGRAREIGLVQEVVPQTALDDAVERAIGALLKSGPKAVVACKRLAFLNARHDADRQLELDQETARLIARLRVSEEGQEGLAAFLEKRLPAWLDRGKATEDPRD